MVCHHLKDLYQLCQDHQLRLGSSDLIRVVCLQCGQQEVCPSTLMDEYDSRRGEEPPPAAGQPPTGDARVAEGSSDTA